MKSSTATRSKTRQFLVQALYQAQLTGESFNEVTEAFITDHNMKRADLGYFREALKTIDDDREELISLIESVGEKRFTELDPVERGVLLLGCFELRSRVDVPYRVVINEGVELARSFGATDSHKYVNSILDQLARQLRQHG